MRLKTIFAMAVAVLFTTSAMAQEAKKCPTPEQKIERCAARMQEKLMLNDATAAKFAPIYKEYLAALAACKPACDKCENPTDEQIKKNIQNCLDAQQKKIEIEKKYFKKLSPILSGRQLRVVFCKNNKKAACGKKGFGPKGPKKQCGAKKGCFKAPACGPQMQGKCPFPAGAPKFGGKCPKMQGKCPFPAGAPKFDGKCPKMQGKCLAPANCPKDSVK
jgi:hypothetical protein